MKIEKLRSSISQAQIYDKDNQTYLKDGRLVIDNTLIYAKFILQKTKEINKKQEIYIIYLIYIEHI